MRPAPGGTEDGERGGGLPHIPASGLHAAGSGLSLGGVEWSGSSFQRWRNLALTAQANSTALPFTDDSVEPGLPVSLRRHSRQCGKAQLSTRDGAGPATPFTKSLLLSHHVGRHCPTLPHGRLAAQAGSGPGLLPACMEFLTQRGSTCASPRPGSMRTAHHFAVPGGCTETHCQPGRPLCWASGLFPTFCYHEHC